MINADVAFVLSGGGACAAYEVGVMKAICGGDVRALGLNAVEPGVLSGTSAGALNASVMAAELSLGSAAALETLEGFWINQLAGVHDQAANGVYRIRLDPRELLNVRNLTEEGFQAASLVVDDLSSLARAFVRRGWNVLLSTESTETKLASLADVTPFIGTDRLAATLRRIIDPEKIQASPCSLGVAAVDWQSGRLHVFKKDEMVGEPCYAIIQASCAVPGIFPPVRLNHTRFVDGGVIMNTPLKPAIDAGAGELHVIYLDPSIEMPTARLESTLESFERVLAIQFATQVNQDLAVAKSINDSLLALHGAKTDPGVAEASRRALVRSLKPVLEHALAAADYRLLTIHCYHPHPDHLGFGTKLLDFSRPSIQRLIERGYADAIAHDCSKSGCILPKT